MIDVESAKTNIRLKITGPMTLSNPTRDSLNETTQAFD